MFRYSDTDQVSQPKERQRKVVTKVRRVTYVNNNPNPKITEPTVTEGFETVEEAVVSADYNRPPLVVGTKEVDGRCESQIRRPARDEEDREEQS